MSSRSVNQSGKTGAWNVGLSASSSVISQVHDLIILCYVRLFCLLIVRILYLLLLLNLIIIIIILMIIIKWLLFCNLLFNFHIICRRRCIFLVLLLVHYDLSQFFQKSSFFS